MIRPLALALALVTLLGAGVCLAEEQEWHTVVSGPVTVKNRAIPGSPIKEVWAEGEVNAPLIDVQDALMNVQRLKSFMPYMQDARIIKEQPEDQSVFIYTLIDLPVVGKRDYVTQVWQPQAAKPDGTGTFEAKWVARPKHLPERSGVVRLQVNDGMWLATPREGGKTWLVHKFAVDPGGWIPAFAANMGNEKGVGDTYKNVEREAQKRMKERLAAEALARQQGTGVAAGGK
ncbi:MAG: hypothetical protein JNJ54_13970 [Myxococcaceae bacterium]|nr:hypothetical protein [Myxococcaceae bacterium]